jgi:hypothetical protein
MSTRARLRTVQALVEGGLKREQAARTARSAGPQVKRQMTSRFSLYLSLLQGDRLCRVGPRQSIELPGISSQNGSYYGLKRSICGVKPGD